MANKEDVRPLTTATYVIQTTVDYITETLKAPFLRNTTECQLLLFYNRSNGSAAETSVGIDSHLNVYMIVILLLCIGVFTSIMARFFNFARRSSKSSEVSCLYSTYTES